MNRRKFISSIISAFLFFFQSRLWSNEKSQRQIPDFFNTPDLIKNNTLVLFDPVFFQHHIHPDHPESPKRMEFVRQAIVDSGLSDVMVNLTPREDNFDWITTVHTNRHIQAIKQEYPIAHQVAAAAVSACLSAVDKVFSQEATNVFCATRPPGHHALNTGREEGFCYYNSIAIAAKYAQIKYKVKKILILDRAQILLLEVKVHY